MDAAAGVGAGARPAARSRRAAVLVAGARPAAGAGRPAQPRAVGTRAKARCGPVGGSWCFTSFRPTCLW